MSGKARDPFVSNQTDWSASAKNKFHTAAATHAKRDSNAACVIVGDTGSQNKSKLNINSSQNKG